MIYAERFTTKSDLDDWCWECGKHLTNETIYATPKQVLCKECIILLLNQNKGREVEMAGEITND